ncbi:PAS domain S-box protein [Alkalimonas collagenimarina]|uniref:histidine kinase n=1 Tax=Alkalimonas collagenimarina TaxID=400390 RepID=A0ABT9GZ27_9GAMM|nr:PAS domain S-box protein [Alkalimonas collagenimarina]MDP4536311.1 PAS domain S-box protein [Alkalimonas collagenimarina]
MSDDYYQLIAESTPDALVALSPDGEVLQWNQGAEHTFGYSKEECLGRSVFKLVVPADLLAQERTILQQACMENIPAYEAYRVRKDGSLIYLNISMQAVHRSDGQLDFILTNNKDVTHLKTKRDARFLEARYRDLLDSTPDAIVMVNVFGRIVLANGQAENAFGWQRDELLGKPVESLLPERYHSSHVGHRSDFFTNPRTRSMGAGLELYGVRKNGEEFPVEISLSPLKTEEGVLVMSAIRDITDRKRVERELQSKNMELERANNAKDSFLAVMSHELRTPLNAIIGFTGTLLMKLPGPLTSEQEKQLSTVQRSAKHLLSLINDLLDLAKISAGKISVDMETLDAGTIAMEVISTLQPAAEQKGLQLEHNLAEDTPKVLADKRALHQIILNLINNALKFTESGRVDISLEPTLDDAGKLWVELHVKDTGIGISSEDQANLFSAFTRLNLNNNAEKEGTGLGLHLSQQLAGLQGGQILCQSQQGKGSTFTLRLQGAEE